MQAAAAFIQVQVALNWLADNAMRLADWFASSHRVTQLTDAIDRLDESLGPIGKSEVITLGDSADNRVYLRDLNIALHDGKVMIDGAEAVFSPGEKILVKGDSGTGKSTLIRAMAGLWPWGSGEMLRPAGATIAFFPQRPYFPLGTLRAAVLYPYHEANIQTRLLPRCSRVVVLNTVFRVLTRRTTGVRYSLVASSSDLRSPAHSSIRPTFSSWMNQPHHSMN